MAKDRDKLVFISKKDDPPGGVIRIGGQELESIRLISETTGMSISAVATKLIKFALDRAIVDKKGEYKE